MNKKGVSKELKDNPEIKKRVINFAIEAFHRQGIKEVTMDDISHGLHISKRTIYQFFADKEDLIIACIQQSENEELAFLKELEQQRDNILDVMFLNIERLLQEVEGCCPKFFSDAHLYPRVKARVEKRSSERIEETLKMLYKGVEQGLFLSHIDFRLVVQAMINEITHVMLENEDSNITLEHCLLNVVLIVVRGCATERGIARIDDFRQRYIEKRRLDI